MVPDPTQAATRYYIPTKVKDEHSLEGCNRLVRGDG